MLRQGAFDEFRRSLLRERQREGITVVKQRGAYKARKTTLTPDRAAELLQRAANGIPKIFLACEYGVSRRRCISTCARPSSPKPSPLARLLAVRSGPLEGCNEMLFVGKGLLLCCGSFSMVYRPRGPG
jgi:hypothetical protein